MDTSRRLPPLEVWGENSVFKVLLGSNSQYPFFIFSCKYDLPNFNPLRPSEMYIYIFLLLFPRSCGRRSGSLRQPG